MKAYEVWYSCYEDTGVFGYFLTEAAAKRCLEANALREGEWINGDRIQLVRMSEIEIQEGD